MRKLAIVVALSSTVLATPALARDGAWYIGGDFGAMIVEDVSFDVGATEDAIVVDHEYGFDGAGFVGYDLGAFRIEAEASYKKADLESFSTVIRLPGEGPGFPAQRDFAGGNSTALSFMINGMLDFGDDDGISGFVGGGVGMARVNFNNQRAFSTGAFIEDRQRFAWQLDGVVRRFRQLTDGSLRFFNVPTWKCWLGGRDFSRAADAQPARRHHAQLGRPIDIPPPRRRRNVHGTSVPPRFPASAPDPAAFAAAPDARGR